MGKLGLIAGGGGLPVAIAQSCRAAGRALFVVRLKGMADPVLDEYAGAWIGLAELGRCVKALRRAKCEQVCFAGIVRRPEFNALKPDLSALKYLPEVIAAAARGDDALLRAVLHVFEREGFQVEGVGEAGRDLLLRRGSLGRLAPGEGDSADIAAALQAARQVGLSDAGQGAVARRGLVIATEDRHGTDAMLAHCVPDQDRQRRGVLAKVPKPAQDRRVDLPTIGLTTIERVAAAGLAGVVGEAGSLLIVEPDAVREAADRLGIFVVGVESGGRRASDGGSA